MINFTESKMNQFTYKDWIVWFAYNDRERLTIDFSEEKELSDKEIRLYFPSIREFQKGEGSDGRIF